jgi:hypothetical protein
MAKLFDVSEIELKSGVTAEEFEEFIKEFSSLGGDAPGWTFHHLKCTRGNRQGKYLIIIEIENVEAWHRYFKDFGEGTEELERFWEANPENRKWFDKLDTLCSGFGGDTEDRYVELD